MADSHSFLSRAGKFSWGQIGKMGRKPAGERAGCFFPTARHPQILLGRRKFYLSAADKVEDPKKKKFFNWLAGWEERHWNLLDRNYRDLSLGYWDEMGFSPF